MRPGKTGVMIPQQEGSPKLFRSLLGGAVLPNPHSTPPCCLVCSLVCSLATPHSHLASPACVCGAPASGKRTRCPHSSCPSFFLFVFKPQ